MVEVFTIAGTKIMAIDGQIQGAETSDGTSRSPFITKTLEILNRLPRGARVLLLGGGTFSIPKKLREDIKLDIYEISSKVVGLAEREFGYDQSDNHIIFTKDAKDLPTRRYDCIVVDLPVKTAPFIDTEEYQDQLFAITDHVIYNALDYYPPTDKREAQSTTLASNLWWLVEVNKQRGE